MTTYSPNSGAPLQTPGDPAVANIWGTGLNSGVSIFDLAVGGTLSLSVAGASNVVLTNTPGAVGQSLNSNFIFTGALTGNIIVFWPLGLGRNFSVTNSTTGAYTLTCAVNNGSGSADGNTVAVAQSATALLSSDGTNIATRITAAAISGFGTAAFVNTTAFDASGAAAAVLSSSLQKASNLSDVGVVATARTNLGLKNGATTTITVSTSGPSGGGNAGDLWLQH